MGKLKEKFMDFYRWLSLPYNLVLAGWIAMGVFGFYTHSALYHHPYQWPELIQKAAFDINWKAFASLTAIGFLWVKGLFFILTKSPFFREYYGQPHAGDYL